MKKQLWGALLALICGFLTCAQAPVVKVKRRALLVDSQLNQKPVPFVLVTLKGPGNSTGITEMKTGLDGTAEKDLPAGKYLLAVSKAVDFDGKRYSWDLEVNLGGAAQTILLSNDNAKIANAPAAVNAISGSDLSEQFKRLKNSVVTVLTESGHGTGFFVDDRGLILTNQHVIANSDYLAVQFDSGHKVVAQLLASDSQKDVALLWANMAVFQNAIAAPLAKHEEGRVAVQEGERVFTIGSPLSLDKILTTGCQQGRRAHVSVRCEYQSRQLWWAAL